MKPVKIAARDAVTGPVVEIVGDLDHGTAHELREHVAATALRPGQRLVLDLSRLEFCDSSGITALIAARNHAAAAGADVALAGVPDNTLRILRIVGLDQVFALHPDAQSAVDAHRAPPPPGTPGSPGLVGRDAGSAGNRV
ncbi:STAS domain-containing protein [Streptomyces sp. IBSBF 2953]|uniref:STAS domain-containing protein n=1 Tax=Streptomyces TaxID=1883 RepID=UPI00211A3B32|nr:STAS domain-containing protein [Streptomyces scabiei]MCQ9184825.1 STAS domain-containing protein [Streptomyces hayashii]MDX3118163.1 STAS domain-containing protein [Streptomyces scabiei]